ncbi:MAG TPA: class I SAM-dependent methyltransferase [Candidatus Bathyarchaeia archaeon]|nr:class I SAM-dependent methyltransferase [Candidatus Bathyarchaeia archaeon]
MFGNLLSVHDLSLLVEKIRQGRLADIVSRIARGKDAVDKSWSHVEYPPKNWWDIPEVMERWNQMVSGDPRKDYVAYFLERHAAARRAMRALSLGSGTGSREVELARSGLFARVDGVDFSAPRIAYAARRAREAGFVGIINYVVGDAARVDLEPGSYDVVIAEQFLHHVSPLEPMLSRIGSLLARDGFFMFNEFVGPARFQWTDTQLKAVNALLAELPEKYRIRWKSGTVKRRIHRPGRLAVRLFDPTEAAESSRIVPLVREAFEVIELKGYGGSVLQPLFNDIAFNFLSRDPETGRYIRHCFETEDALLARGEISHDFVVGICARFDGDR